MASLKLFTFFILIILLFSLNCNLISGEEVVNNTTMSNVFLYFAYGSNLLAKRIHINNPSAVRVGIGKIKDYRVDFAYYSHRWKGCAATIVRRKNEEVWGAIWELDNKHMDSLDKQEGVGDNIYFRFEVDVFSSDGKIRKCQVYEQCKTPEFTENIENLADDRKPSQVYLNVILKGAEESGLPIEYQNFLKKIPHNGYNGSVDISTNLKIVEN